MEKYTLDKYDFKRYLLNEIADARQEELIFWKNEIPLPLDLVYNIFERRGTLIRSFLDHIAAAYLYTYVRKAENRDWKAELRALPSPSIDNNSAQIINSFANTIDVSRVKDLMKEIAESLMIYDYNPQPRSLEKALSHEGRKYRRLYLPLSVKNIILKYNHQLLSEIGVSNGDMFGNVVADELSIYRSGFSDAFAVIFNRLLDFILDNHDGKTSAQTSAHVRVAQTRPDNLTAEAIKYDTIQDGSIWEPRYVNAKTTFVLNKNHPYCEIKQKDKSAERVIADIAEVMSKIENETIKDSERRVLEISRQELSRRLRLMIESLHSAS